MHIQHSAALWQQFPQLVPGALFVGGIHSQALAAPRLEKYYDIARRRLSALPEGEWPEIQAWRRGFSSMGLKPTQYRCAAESLLRRFKTENGLPQIHPVIDLCNAISIAYGMPIAVFDIDQVNGFLEVRHALGSEEYEAFSGELESPKTGEVIFADQSSKAHARRWCNRQSKLSSIQPATQNVLIVAEALHDDAPMHVAQVLDVLAQELSLLWQAKPTVKILSAAQPYFARGNI
jgi:DNA/RNA-binding domain of Phe-tRNA-synthetase-like protein